jgi:Fe2+ or Zn2+ uptake regulation protein
VGVVNSITPIRDQIIECIIKKPGIHGYLIQQLVYNEDLRKGSNTHVYRVLQKLREEDLVRDDYIEVEQNIWRRCYWPTKKLLGERE